MLALWTMVGNAVYAAFCGITTNENGGYVLILIPSKLSRSLPVHMPVILPLIVCMVLSIWGLVWNIAFSATPLGWIRNMIPVAFPKFGCWCG